MFCSFLIGRERDSAESEVAQLIQQSPAQDHLTQQATDVIVKGDHFQQLENNLYPKDDVMEHHLHDHQAV